MRAPNPSGRSSGPTFNWALPYRSTHSTWAITVSASACGSATTPGSSGAPAEAVAREPRKNVLIVTFDTTRADALGAYGQERATTPNLDRFAERGALFENAYTSAPSTLPSHATIMTGLDVPSHGARHNGTFRLAAERTTLAEVLHAAGYVAPRSMSRRRPRPGRRGAGSRDGRHPSGDPN